MSEYRDDTRVAISDSFWTFKKTFFLILALVILIGGTTWVLRVVSQPARIIAKTLDADNVIEEYEWFKTQHQDFLAIKKKAKNADIALQVFSESAGDRSTWTFEDKNEHARLNTIVLGLNNQREDIVALYNARSKMVNRSIFKRGVPISLE
jgi:hypothetical protein